MCHLDSKYYKRDGGDFLVRPMLWDNRWWLVTQRIKYPDVETVSGKFMTQKDNNFLSISVGTAMTNKPTVLPSQDHAWDA